MREVPYNRQKAVDYARRWALNRNPTFYDFQAIGGDCTNFSSQCLYAGAEIMNYTPVTGWYYRSAGPFARRVSREQVQPGDLVQLGDQNGRFYHTPVITAVAPTIFIAAHTYDALDVPLSSYTYHTARFLRIEGVRKW